MSRPSDQGIKFATRTQSFRLIAVGDIRLFLDHILEAVGLDYSFVRDFKTQDAFVRRRCYPAPN